MPIYWVILLTLSVGIAVLERIIERAETGSHYADTTSIARNLLTYRNALAEYAYTHKAAIGPVPETALALPTWYSRLPRINGYVVSGASFTYYASPPEGLVAELVSLSGSSVAVGYVQAGKIISPSAGATDIVVPSAIPNGAAIAFQ